MSPGAWLTEMSQERYEVMEKKTTKKVTQPCLFFENRLVNGYGYDLELENALWVLIAETNRVESHGKHGN